MSKKKKARVPVSYTEPCEGKKSSPSIPTSSADEKHLTKTFSLRCTAAEKETLRARAKDQGVSASELLRDALGLIQIPKRKRRPTPKADPKLLAALNAIGVNCNQLARVVNSARRSGDMRQLDAIRILAALVSIDRELAAILSSEITRKDNNAA